MEAGWHLRLVFSKLMLMVRHSWMASGPREWVSSFVMMGEEWLQPLAKHYPADWIELFAMRQGVLLAQEMTLSKVIFESDALSVIQAITQDLCGSKTSHLIQGIQLAKASFFSCSFHHVKRDYNRVAHKLAQFAKCNHASNVWKGVTPPFLDHLIQSGLG